MQHNLKIDNIFSKLFSHIKRMIYKKCFFFRNDLEMLTCTCANLCHTILEKCWFGSFSFTMLVQQWELILIINTSYNCCQLINSNIIFLIYFICKIRHFRILYSLFGKFHHVHQNTSIIIQNGYIGFDTKLFPFENSENVETIFIKQVSSFAKHRKVVKANMVLTITYPIYPSLLQTT